MTETLAVFLRGINVNGNAMAMADLRETLALPGVTTVRTVLATGNAVLRVDSADGPGRWKPHIEQALSQRFGYDAHVFVLHAEDVAAVAQEAAGIAIPTGCHLYVLVMDGPEVYEELNALYEGMTHMPQESFQRAACGAFWIVPRGSTVESPFGNKALGDKRFKARLTSRNINTWLKVLQAMGELKN